MKTSLGAKTLASPAPVWVVCAYDADGRPNGATVAWGGICCSKPPCLAVSLRPATYTHGLVAASKAFTVNVPLASQASLADYFGLASGKDADKFAASGLTVVKSDIVPAPYIDEFPLVFECVLVRTVELGMHTQYVGEIKDVKAEPAFLDADGKLDAARLGALVFMPSSRGYHALGEHVGPAFSMGKVHFR